jgi:hypothetical protein
MESERAERAEAEVLRQHGPMRLKRECWERGEHGAVLLPDACDICRSVLSA